MVLHDLLPLQPIVIVSTKSVPVVLGVDGTTCDCITDPITVYSAQHVISNMVTSLARGKTSASSKDYDAERFGQNYPLTILSFAFDITLTQYAHRTFLVDARQSCTVELVTTVHTYTI